VRPLARSRSASRSSRTIWSAVRRLLMRPYGTYTSPKGGSRKRWTKFRGADQTPVDAHSRPNVNFSVGSVSSSSGIVPAASCP
jgi:hypothetical protein